MLDISGSKQATNKFILSWDLFSLLMTSNSSFFWSVLIVESSVEGFRCLIYGGDIVLLEGNLGLYIKTYFRAFLLSCQDSRNSISLISEYD